MSRNLRRQGNRFDHQVAAAVVTALSSWDSEMKRRNRWLTESQDQSWSRVQKGANAFRVTSWELRLSVLGGMIRRKVWCFPVLRQLSGGPVSFYSVPRPDSLVGEFTLGAYPVTGKIYEETEAGIMSRWGLLHSC